MAGRYARSYKKGRGKRKKYGKSKRYHKKRFVPVRNSFQGFARGQPFPPRFYGKLIYAEPDGSLTSTAGSVGSYTYRLNSLWDPNSSGVGSQPRYFDTLCGADAGTAPYYRYRVYGCLVNVELINTDAADVVDVCINWYPGNASVVDSAREMYERTDCIAGALEPTYGKSMKRFRKYIPMYKLFGISKKEVDTVLDFSAAYNASPTQSGYLSVVAIARGAATAVVQYRITLTFYSEFSQLNDVSDS